MTKPETNFSIPWHLQGKLAKFIEEEDKKSITGGAFEYSFRVHWLGTTITVTNKITGKSIVL